MGNLNKALGKLIGSVIKNIDFDLGRNRISFELEAHYAEGITQHCVNFDRVSLFYFINNNTDTRKIFHIIGEGDYKDGYLEFTYAEAMDEVDFIPKIHKSKAMFKNCSGKVNVFIEIWNKVLFIEAELAYVDGVEYTLV